MIADMTQPLIPSNDALDQYLDSLLHDDPEHKSGQQLQKDEFIPEWALSPFKCLLFTVSGIRLAVPLNKTAGVLEWGKEISTLAYRSQWIMGIINYLNNEIKVIDTSRFMAAGNNQCDSRGQEIRVPRLIFIDDARYALAADSVDEMITFDAGAIRWRRGYTARPWYIGIAAEQQCTLLDVDILLDIINTSEI